MDSVSNAVITVKKNLKDLDETTLTHLTEQAITLDELYGIDMNETLRGVNSLMEQYGLTAQQAMDYIVKGTQNIAQIQLFGAFYDQVSGSDEGIIIKNLKQGKKIVISGDDCTVLQEGKNKFSDTEFWAFPHLRPGSNTISCTSDQCDIVIKYKPRYM